jgi:hypothetical protein
VPGNVAGGRTTALSTMGFSQVGQSAGFSPRVDATAGLHEARLRSSSAQGGDAALYLPAYSPGPNLIEMTWAWIKKPVKEVSTRTPRLLRTLVDKLWRDVTADLCVGSLSHSRYSQST